MNLGIFLYTAVVGLCLGVACGLLFGMGSAAALFFLGVSFVLMLFSVRSVPRARALFALAAAVLAMAALGLVRTDMAARSVAEETLPQYFNTQTVIEGIVRDDPDRRDTTLRLSVDALFINGDEAKGKVLVEVPRDTNVSYGDRVTVRGLLQAPQSFDASGGRQFDYPHYLRVQGVGAVMPRATVLSQEEGGQSISRALFSLKHAFQSSIERMFVEPSAGLLEGILLGARSALPQDLSQAFISSGLVHVVVLSGYNITIVSEAALCLLSFLPSAARYTTGGIMMILFALMVGGGAATVRAVIMALIALLARVLNRPTAALRSLSVAAGAMVLWNPESLLFDPGFILSVLATLGLILLSPAVEKHVAMLPLFARGRFPKVREIAASTIAVQSFVMPALLYFTGTLSPYALLANVLALPVVSYAMLLGFIAGLLALVHPFLAFVPMLGADVLLRWMMFVARTAASLPGGAAVMPAFPAWITALIYIPLVWFAVRLYKKETPPDGRAVRATTNTAFR